MRSSLYVFIFISFFNSAWAMPCIPQEGIATIRLTVEPVELASPNRILEIAVYANDCVTVHLPAFHRHAGDYSVIASSTEIAEIENIQHSDSLRTFSNKQLKQDIAQLNQLHGSGSAPELFEVSDGAVYTLHVWDGENTSKASIHAVFQYADRYPEITRLREFKQAVELLLAFSQREDLQPLQNDTPHAGAQP